MSEWKELGDPQGQVTRPFDGRPVLVFDPNWYDVPYPMIFKRWNNKPGGRWVHWFNDLGPFYPTHWMPLPEPPE